MTTSVLLGLSIVAAFVSCLAAVISVITVRRGADADLKGDMIELSRLVERIAKDARSDKMRRVRMGQKTGESADSAIEVPPGAEDIPLAGGPIASKNDLRRRVLAARGIGR